jgi:cellobiose phosphorylase
MAFAALGDPVRAWQVTELILPPHHGRTAQDVAVYKVEPYVAAADVYSVAPHTGRGGWSWYTGSAGWMYRLLIESLLGLRLQVDESGASLAIEPCLPQSWTSFGLDYRWRGTTYRIEIGLVEDEAEPASIDLDGRAQQGQALALLDEGRTHQVRVRTARSRRGAAVEGALG